MPRYKLTIEYDGGLFHGWQRQAGIPTVQASVESAIEKFCGQFKTVYCSGRTDTGVHAFGQVAHVDLPKAYATHAVRGAINHFLENVPIVIRNVEEVDEDFHARFSSKARVYCYKIVNRPSPLAIDKERAWHVFRKLDVRKMHEAAQILVGHHDFSSFRGKDCQSSSPMKTLEILDVICAENDEIHIHAKSRSFLHHQVRNMVGTLEWVGAGKWDPAKVKEVLQAKDRKAAGPTAPAHGLYFIRVEY